MPELQTGYTHWDGEADGRTVVRTTKKINRVYIPDNLEAAKGPHVYTRTIDENNLPGMSYVAMPYERAENDYPKMLFHPDFHKEPMPRQNDFKELGAYNTAIEEWRAKYERGVIAKDAKHEKELLAKGWLPKPPKTNLDKFAAKAAEEI